MRRARHVIAPLVGAVVVVLLARPAAAEFKKPGDKAGRFMLNLKVGPALDVFHAFNALSAQLGIGVAVTRDNNGYVVLSPGVQVGNQTTAFADGTSLNGGMVRVVVPVGFQYDFPLPLPGLYLYPRLVAGWGRSTPLDDGGGRIRATDFGVVDAAAGVKFVVRGRWNLAFEPFGLPIAISDGGASVGYRVLFVFGFNS